ncbi:bromodomain-containing protein 4-like isoform X2 [Neocloeon triangulifer]|uniref:bromodomain-containing protein 4-like isoform X2 n=1 Tax=Neocloeon triangulifer TaxID=2078957 RepID=UPI00286EC375|nr:bromodomain-containing protein 4-like isoform X2 [Neocloeon triangulifer]
MSSLFYLFAKIVNHTRQIDQTKSDDKVIQDLYSNIWEPLGGIAGQVHEVTMFQKDHEELYRKTLEVILSINWEKIPKINKTCLLTVLETCANKLEKKSPLASERCRILARLIKDPWDSTLVEFLNSTIQTAKGDKLDSESKQLPPAYPVLNNQIVEYINSQPVEVLTTRLSILVKASAFLALNLARVCMKCLQNLEEEDQNLFFDYYVGLLYKFKLIKEFCEEVLHDLKVEYGLQLLQRYSRLETLAPSTLLKKNGMKRASQSIINHLLTQVLVKESVLKSEEDQVFVVAKKWLALNMEWATPESEMQMQITRYGDTAASTLHAYLMCKAIQTQLGPRSYLNSDLLQMIIRRLNEGHNEVKKHIQDRDNLKVATESGEEPDIDKVRADLKREVLEAEHRLAEEFLLLGDLVQDCMAAYRECLLTAFSLRPTPEGLDELEKIAPNEDANGAVGMLSLTGETIGCNDDVCDDLLIILNSARWQLLKWETKWDELKNLCTEYLKDPERVRYKKEELKHAKVPVYMDYEDIHQDRLTRRNRAKESDGYEEIDFGLSDNYSDGEPKPKKVRTVSSSESDFSDDLDVYQRTVLVVSSSEGESNSEPQLTQPVRYTYPSRTKDPKPEFGNRKPNLDLISKLRILKHNSTAVKESAPSLAGQNLQPKVKVSIIRNGLSSLSHKRLLAIVPGIRSMENFTPAPLNPTVQVVQVGQGVPPPQTNSSPTVSQPPPEPPPPPQQPSNGPATNTAPTEQLPKFQQVFGKNFQQQPQTQGTPQVTPQAAPQPPAQPTPAVQQAVATSQPVQQQQVTSGQSRTVTNQASLLRMATPVQITQSSLEALIQAHPQLASALAGREGRIMCFKQGSNIILTDRLRPEVQPGTSGLKRPVKRPQEATPAPSNNSQLENELREFDAVLRSVKERDGSSNNRPEPAATPTPPAPTPTPTVTTVVTTTPTTAHFSQPPPLAFPKTTATVSKAAPAKKVPPPKATVATSTTSPPLSTNSPAPASSSSTPKAAAPTKTPPKASVEDEQTQKRIYEILSEYTEQLRNSPDLNNKPAPRRRSNPPTNPSPKRKKKAKEADEHVPSEDSSSNLAQDSEEHDSVSESGSSLPAESPPAPPAVEPPPQPAPTVAIAIPVSQSKPLVLQRQLMVVGKTPGQKLFRVIPAHNSNLRALTSAPTLLLQQMCKPEQLINFQSVRSVKLPVMSTQSLSGVQTQQPVVMPFASQGIKKEVDNTLIETLLQGETLKTQVEEHVKVEPSEEEEEETNAHSASQSPVPETKAAAPLRVKSVPAKCTTPLQEKKRRLVRQDNMQKSLSEECEDLGVDAPSTSELFPDADLPFELSNNSDSSLSYLDTCHQQQQQQQQQRRRNGAEVNGRGAATDGGSEDSSAAGDESPKRRKLCLTRPFAALKSRKEDEAADTDGSGDEAAKAKRAVKPRTSCACCGPTAPKVAKKMNGKAGKKK